MLANGDLIKGKLGRELKTKEGQLLKTQKIIIQ